MRCFFLLVGATILAGCAIGPSETSNLISGDSRRVNALSNVNKQLVGPKGVAFQPDTFTGCLDNQKSQTGNTFAKYLTTNKSDDKSPITLTITSDNLSAYTNALWNYSKQDKSTMLRLLALHRAHDRTCFEKEILTLKNKKADGASGTNVSLSDYEQSYKILGNIYDYLHSTLTRTEYSELDEQFARDHIPVKVILPTT